MNNAVLILPHSLRTKRQPRFIFVKIEEVSKRNYPPKAKGSNVRGVGTFLTPTKALNNGWTGHKNHMILHFKNINLPGSEYH